MPRYYFHLSAPDQFFRDPIGFEVGDLSAAHLRAVQLAGRVMMIGDLASCEPSLQRWTVVIADEYQRLVMTVIFPLHFEKPRAHARLNGARVLQERLTATWNESLPCDRVRQRHITA